MPETQRVPETQRIEEFLAHLAVEKSFSGNTLAAYRNDLTQFISFLQGSATGAAADEDDPLIHLPAPLQVAAGDDFWATVEQRHIVAFLLFLKERSYATSTVARKIAAVKSFFHWAAAGRLIPADPTTDLESPRVAKYLPQAISVDNVEALLLQPTLSETPEALRDRAMLEV